MPIAVEPRRFRSIAALALVLQMAIVVTGGAVRLTDSGLGCNDWPTCEHEHVVPAASASHAWIEFGNRLFTFAVLASVLAAVLAAHRLRERRRDLVLLSWGLVAGVVAQILIGAVVVLTDLRTSTVSIHFLASMLLVADATVLLHRTGGAGGPRGEVAIDTTTADVGTLVVAWAAVVLVLGTLVTGAGPHGGDPEAKRLDLDISTIARLHASAVWLLVALVVTTLLLAWRRGAPRAVLLRGEAALAAMAVQGAVGYLQYATGVPAGLVALHLLGAVVVWFAIVWFRLGLGRRQGRDVHVDTGRELHAVA